MPNLACHLKTLVETPMANQRKIRPGQPSQVVPDVLTVQGLIGGASGLIFMPQICDLEGASMPPSAYFAHERIWAARCSKVEKSKLSNHAIIGLSYPKDNTQIHFSPSEVNPFSVRNPQQNERKLDDTPISNPRRRAVSRIGDRASV